jgi:hypothetical protein
MQTMLNKTEKKQLVINLYEEGKPIREIAQQAHLSFGTIGKIIKQINSPEKDEAESETLNNKSKETKALYLFLHGKRPIEVAIELSSAEVEYFQQEFWILNELDELALAYLGIKSHLDLFLRLFHIMKPRVTVVECINIFCISLQHREVISFGGSSKIDTCSFA